MFYQLSSKKIRGSVDNMAKKLKNNNFFFRNLNFNLILPMLNQIQKFNFVSSFWIAKLFVNRIY